MNSEEFESLAIKCLAGNASEKELHQLKQLMQENQKHAQDYKDLKEALHIAQNLLPLAEHTDDESPKLPEWRKAELRTVVRSSIPHKDNKRTQSRPHDIFSYILPYFKPQNYALAAFTLLLGISLFLRPWAEPQIQFGRYTPAVTRLSQDWIVSIPTISQIQDFDSESSFTNWQSRIVAPPTIQIWFDEENELIRIRSISFLKVIEESVPLPARESDRQAALEH
ncbi:MAG: hypothetical protein AAF571_10655, partial [Verrucomicrobiota bacterium]